MISKVLPELAQAPAVVFDIRYYAIDTHVILEHMLAEPIAEIVRPDHAPTTWRRDTWGFGSKTPKFTGKLVWLIGPDTQSYLETIMGTVEHYHLGEVVGSPSSGANGNVRHIYLPGGVEVMLTGLRAIRHDGGQFHNVGVRPTVPVERTLAGVREGLDEVLLRGLAVARAP